MFPPQPAGMWQAAFNGERTWTTSAGQDKYRRGLYTFWRRDVPYPSMTTFDAPSREICAVRRIRTNTPLQALVTLTIPSTSNGASHRQADHGAKVVRRRKYACATGLRLSTGRPATDEQVAALSSLYEAASQHDRADAKAAGELSGMTAQQAAANPQAKNDTKLDAAEVAAWTVVANVLLNLMWCSRADKI